MFYINAGKRRQETKILMQTLKFEVLGGGIITIDTKKCKQCPSKICEKVCQGKFIKIEEEIPTLSSSLEAIKRGECVECLACELDCEFYGRKAIKIVYPMPELEEYLHRLEKKKIKPVWMSV